MPGAAKCRSRKPSAGCGPTWTEAVARTESIFRRRSAILRLERGDAMAFYPKIQSPCPYKSQLAAIMDGGVCRMCERQVFDLTRMDDAARRAFFRGCDEEVCVSYAVPLRPALAAAAMVAALTAPNAALAQDAPAVNLDVEEMQIFVGGIKDPANVEHDRELADDNIAELPVVYDDDSAAPPASGTGRGPTQSTPEAPPLTRPADA
jgi:hypothetical protein